MIGRRFAYSLLAVGVLLSPIMGLSSPTPGSSDHSQRRRARIEPIPLRAWPVIIPIPTHVHGFVLLADGRRAHHEVDRHRVRRHSASTKVVTITEKQNGKVVNARAGQTMVLKLDPGLGWNFSSQGIGVLKALGTPGATTRFRAVAPGTAVIKAYGRMIPNPGQMVAMFVVPFEVTIHVSR